MSSCTIRCQGSPRRRALRRLSSWKNDGRAISWPPRSPASRATHRATGIRPALAPAAMHGGGQVDQLAVLPPGPGGDHGQPAGAQQHRAAGQDRGEPGEQVIQPLVGEVGRVVAVAVVVLADPALRAAPLLGVDLPVDARAVGRRGDDQGGPPGHARRQQRGQQPGVAADHLGGPGRALAAGMGDVGGGERGPAVLVLDAEAVAAEVDGLDQGGADTAHRVGNQVPWLGVAPDRGGGDGGQHLGRVRGRLGRYRPRRWARRRAGPSATPTGAVPGHRRDGNPGAGRPRSQRLSSAWFSSGLGEDQKVVVDWAAAGRGRAGAGSGGGEAVAVDGGADQDDVLGVNQAGGAGSDDGAPGGAGERPAGGGGAGDDGEDPAGAQHPLAGGERGPGVFRGVAARLLAAAAGDGQPGGPGGGIAGRRQRRRVTARARGRGRPGDEGKEGRPAAAAASVTAGEQPRAAATRSPGTENVSMTRRAAATVTGPPHGRPSGASRAGRPGQMLSGTPGPVPPAVRLPAAKVPGPARRAGRLRLG